MVQEIIDSGILELFCLGQVTDEEKKLIESMQEKHQEIRQEIIAIRKTLYQISTIEKVPQAFLERRIFDEIASEIAAELNLPPLLTKSSSKEDWYAYLEKQQIKKPEGNELLFFLPLPSNHNLTTYIVFAKCGGNVEESHETELERLFMLNGSCSITINGIEKQYHENDFVEIPAGTLHSAIALSNDMIVVGQRLAA